MIIELSYFDTFREAISNCGVKKVMPNARSLEESIKLYESFPHAEGSYKEAAKKYGVLRIKLQI